MSSLRPLITITVLAFVGVILYMKINETEPKLPSELAGQTWSNDVEVGGGMGVAAGPASVEPVLPTDEAPAFTPPPAAASAPPAASDAAPAWTPPPAPAVDAAAARPETKPASPAIPEMPAVPSTGDQAATSKPTAPENSAAPPAPPKETKLDKTDVAAMAAAAAAGVAAMNAAESDAPRYGEAAPATPAPTNDAPPFNPNPPVASESPVTPNAPPVVGAAAPAADSTPATKTATMYPAAKLAAQGALDRGELAQALAILSEWYGDPSLTPAESAEVDGLLGQLAGSVIYEGPPAHRLEDKYLVRAGDTLDSIALRHKVSAELLAKINGLAAQAPLEPGQELKVVTGPFSAIVDLSQRRLTLMLDRMYAGRFDVEVDPSVTVEEGQWAVNQKLIAPGAGGLYGQSGGAGAEDRSIILANVENPSGQAAVLRAPSTDPIGAQPKSRVIALKSTDIPDVFDILSEGSQVTIRR